MNWLRILLQSASFLEASRYWRTAVICLAFLLMLLAIAFGSVALALLAFFLFGAAVYPTGGS
jgi:hypothetical protein